MIASWRTTRVSFEAAATERAAPTRARGGGFESQRPVQHEFIKLLHRRFGEEGIEIPFPIRTVIMKGGEDPTEDSPR